MTCIFVDKHETYVFIQCIAYITTTDHLTTQGARASGAMVLTVSCRNIAGSAPLDLTSNIVAQLHNPSSGNYWKL